MYNNTVNDADNYSANAARANPAPDKNSVWPVMVTAFTDTGEVDYGAEEALVEWYVERGVGGLFVNCAMSEMVALSLKERAKIAAAVKKHSGVPVAATGHLAYSYADQSDEIKTIEDTGADIIVLLTNRVALPGTASGVWKDNLLKLISLTDKNTLFGLYEWPGHPGVWRLTDDELDFAAKTGRFVFMKDTCCNLETLSALAKIVENTPMRLYNANAASYLASLRYGFKGFCGIMANYHPEIYAWLAEHFSEDAEKAENVQSFLTVASFGEGRVSPVSAKYHISRTGAPIGIFSRIRDCRELSALNRYETEQMALLADWVKSYIGIPVKETGGMWNSKALISRYRDDNTPGTGGAYMADEPHTTGGTNAARAASSEFIQI
jgi:4-hydroxy-tetrahydrodipicolinate synthase